MLIKIVDENDNELGIDQPGGVNLALPPRNSPYFVAS